MAGQPAPPALAPRRGPGLERLPPLPSAGIGMGRVAYADARQHWDIVQSLVRSIRNAKTRIWLATPYFLPSWKVRRALLRPRGVVSTCACC